MPIPILIWGAGAGAAALWGLVKAKKAASQIKKAKCDYEARRSAYDQFITIFDMKHKHTSGQFDELAKVRLQAMTTMGDAVRFLEKAKLKDRDLIEKFQITPQKMLDWKKASVNAVEVLGGLVSSGASGAAAAAGSYSLVGLLASASTGTAISTLSGAAATNATLAWLGGGTIAAGGGGMAAGTIVLGGLVAGPAIMVMGFMASWQASKIESQAEAYISELVIDQAEKEKMMVALDAVVKRVHEVRGSTIKIDGELRQLIDNSDPADERDAYMVAKTAKSLGELLEVTIIDKDGKLMESEG